MRIGGHILATKPAGELKVGDIIIWRDLSRTKVTAICPSKFAKMDLFSLQNVETKEMTYKRMGKNTQVAVEGLPKPIIRRKKKNVEE